MAFPFAVQRWFDGTWWEVTVPDGWEAKQDKSIDGGPYRFSSPGGAYLQLGSGKGVELSGYRDDVESRNLKSEDERRAYLMTQRAAWMVRWEGSALRYFLGMIADAFAIYPKVEKCDAGKLRGYIFRTGSGANRKCLGYFTFRDWTIYALFRADDNHFDGDFGEALSILRSMQFRA